MEIKGHLGSKLAKYLKSQWAGARLWLPYSLYDMRFVTFHSGVREHYFLCSVDKQTKCWTIELSILQKKKCSVHQPDRVLVWVNLQYLQTLPLHTWSHGSEGSRIPFNNLRFSSNWSFCISLVLSMCLILKNTEGFVIQSRPLFLLLAAQPSVTYMYVCMVSLTVTM